MRVEYVVDESQVQALTSEALLLVLVEYATRLKRSRGFDPLTGLVHVSPGNVVFSLGCALGLDRRKMNAAFGLAELF